MKGQYWLILFAATATALMIATDPAAGQTSNCAGRDQVMERLADGFGETRQSIAMGQNDQVIEVFASVVTGTWTITVTLPNGLTCLVASGEGYEPVSEAPAPDA